MRILLVSILLFAAASGSPLLRDDGMPSSRDAEIRADAIDYRLPNNSAPISYQIKLSPHIIENNFTFDGLSTAIFHVLEATTSLTLHSNALTIDENSTTLAFTNGTSIAVSTHEYDTERHFVILGFSSPLAIGTYNLTIKYTGILDDDMKGFYRSSYTNSDNETVWLATTQFEPTYARRAFPCWDEPALKATFEIWIKHFSNCTAISNMPVSEQTAVDETDGKLYTKFDVTPNMSTYLVAFVVSDFGYIGNDDGTFNVWSRKNALDTAQYAYEIGVKELNCLEAFTNVSYSLPKMDQIAIPDFSAGAMENWGLVTYREAYLLFEEGVSTTTNKQNIATVISHEFGHQWFGNLVSPLWWNYIWLNEGFATYFEYYTTEEAEDNWRLMEQFVVRVLQVTAFSADGLATSHPMNYDVGSPSEISSLFDSISYSKAGAVIRMMSHFLSEDAFKAGLTKYLNARAYDVATPDDLWEAMQEAADEQYVLPNHLDVKTVMDTWTEQMGFPVINVVRNYTTTTTEICQERFLLKSSTITDDHDYKWWVPINYATQTSPDFSDTLATDWIRAQDECIMISGFNSSGWVIFNKQQTGYYRVNYDDTNWGLITDYLNSENYAKIHVVNRAQLLDDALNLARSGRLNYSVALDLTTYLKQEIDYIPWYSAFTGFTFLNRLLAGTEEYDSFKAYILDLTSNLRENVGSEELDEDEHVTKFNRINAMTWSCNLGLDSCRTDANEKLIAWLDDSAANPITPDMKSVIYCAGLRQANASTWNKMWNKYLATDLSSEKTLILSGLGCAEDEDILTNYMDLATTSDSGIRSQDSSSAFAAVYIGNPDNVDIAFNYIANNLDKLISYYGGASSVRTFLSGIGYRITTSSQLEKLKAFAEEHSETLGTAAATGISNAEDNLAWIETYEPVIREWLKTQSSETEGSAAAGISFDVFLTIALFCVARFY